MPVHREAGHRAGDPCEAGFCLQTSPLGQRYSLKARPQLHARRSQKLTCLQVTPPPQVSGRMLQGKDSFPRLRTSPAPPHALDLLHPETLISLPGVGPDGLSRRGPRRGYLFPVASCVHSPGSDRISIFFLRGGWQVLKDAREPLGTLQLMFASLAPLRSRAAAGRHPCGRASRFRCLPGAC